jgi:hypothetical protein
VTLAVIFVYQRRHEAALQEAAEKALPDPIF